MNCVPKDVFSVLTTICHVVPPGESLLVCKASKIVSRLGRRLPVAPRPNQDLLMWLLQAVTDCSSVVVEDVLHALCTVLKLNPYYDGQLYNNLIGNNGILLKFVEDHTHPYPALAALKCWLVCLSNCDKQDGALNEYLERSSKIALMYLLKTRQKGQDEMNHCEILISCCSILTLALYKSPDLELPSTDAVVGACRCWTLLGLLGCESVTPLPVRPSQQTVAEVGPPPPNRGEQRKLRKHRNQKTKRRHERNPPEIVQPGDYTPANKLTEDPLHHALPLPGSAGTSESDVSDSESSRLAKLKEMQAKARWTALNLLSQVIRCVPKSVIFGYWFSLVPSSTPGVSMGLLACLQKEPSAAGRVGALSALLSLLTVCRTFLQQAETSKRAITSFTPLSVSLGNSLQELHSVLDSSLKTERHAGVLVAALKCVVACVQATNYTNVGGDMLSGIVKQARDRLLRHSEWTVHVGALIVVGCILSIKPPPPDIFQLFQNISEKNDSTSFDLSSMQREILLQKKEESVELSDEEVETDEVILEEDLKIVKKDGSERNAPEMSWVVEICLCNLGWSTQSKTYQDDRRAVVQVRLESLQVLSAIAYQLFDALLSPFMHILAVLLTSALDDTESDICFHAAKLVSSIGQAMLNSKDAESSDSLHRRVSFWSSMLRCPLTRLLQSQQAGAARAQACDCISSVGETTFTHLPDSMKVLCATLLLGLSSDEESLVRAAAIRALGVCITYKDWREDPGLMSDCGESVLRVLEKAAPLEKIKAMWALASITDAHVLNAKDPENEVIDGTLMLRLLESSIAATKDSDKIKMSAVRGIGGLCYLMQAPLLAGSSRLKGAAQAGAHCLVHCVSHATNMKVRWNACYALGKLMENQSLYECLKEQQSVILCCLSEAMLSCHNLKVRGLAAGALRALTQRHLYAGEYCACLHSTLKAMEGATHVTDFTELKHIHTLVEQLCMTLSHIVCLLQPPDLPAILQFLPMHADTCKQLLGEVHARIQPQGQTSQKLLEAAKAVSVLSATSDKEKECLALLKNMFDWMPALE